MVLVCWACHAFFIVVCVVGLWVLVVWQAVVQEPLFKGTTVYLAATLACALKAAGEIASNRGLESDGEKFAQAKPHAPDVEGHGNPVWQCLSPVKRVVGSLTARLRIQLTRLQACALVQCGEVCRLCC